MGTMQREHVLDHRELCCWSSYKSFKDITSEEPLMVDHIVVTEKTNAHHHHLENTYVQAFYNSIGAVKLDIERARSPTELLNFVRMHYRAFNFLFCNNPNTTFRRKIKPTM